MAKKKKKKKKRAAAARRRRLQEEEGDERGGRVETDASGNEGTDTEATRTEGADATLVGERSRPGMSSLQTPNGSFQGLATPVGLRNLGNTRLS